MAARIKTSHEYPPIPDRQFDWLAYREGDEEGAQGYGPTEQLAIDALLLAENELADIQADAIVQAFEPLSKLARK